MKQEKKQTETSVLEKLSSIEKLLKKKDDKPLSFKEACAYLGFKPSYLYKLSSQHKIPTYKPAGKMLFFSKFELDDWIFSKSKVTSGKLKEGQCNSSLEENGEEEDEEPP